MSLKTWKQEFYPIPAQEAAEKGMIACIKHSLQKWIGLRPENRARHGVKGVKRIYSTKFGYYDGCLDIDSGTCSLCQKYDKTSLFCDSCPIYRATGKVCHSWVGSPYGQYTFDGSPEPMINVLTKTLEWARKRHGK